MPEVRKNCDYADNQPNEFYGFEAGVIYMVLHGFMWDKKLFKDCSDVVRTVLFSCYP